MAWPDTVQGLISNAFVIRTNHLGSVGSVPKRWNGSIFWLPPRE